jgi:hypothetical protein
MSGDANEGADDDVASDADDAADEYVDVCLEPGTIANANDLDDDGWKSLSQLASLFACPLVSKT